MITLVQLSVCRLKSPCLYYLPNHLDKDKSISLLQRVQGCCSLLIIIHDKNLEFTTKLRIITCYLLVLIYYLAVVFYTVHTFTYYLLIVIYLLFSSHCLVFFIIFCPVSFYFPRLILSLLLSSVFFIFPSPVFSYSLTRFDVP